MPWLPVSDHVRTADEALEQARHVRAMRNIARKCPPPAPVSMPVRNEDPRITEIMTAVCGHFRVRRDDLYEDFRRGGPKNARDTAMYLVKEKTGCTWMHIGRVFKRSEVVVRKASQRVNQILDKDKEHPVYVAVMKLRKRLHMEQDSGEDLDSSTG